MSTIDIVDRLREPGVDYAHISRSELQTFREELRTARDGAIEVAERIVRSAAGRTLTGPQERDQSAALRRAEDAVAILERVEDALTSQALDRSSVVDLTGSSFGSIVGSRDAYAEGVPLTRDQTFNGFVRSQGLVRHGEDDLSLGKYVRGMATGNWKDADPERRAMAEGTTTAGGYLVPTILSSRLIDLARNRSAVLRAGASVVPMPNRTLDVAKWTGDPAPAFHTEGATISPTDATVGKVTLTAQALASLTIVSRELVEDAEIDQVLADALATKIALTIDFTALYGSGTAPTPRGVKNQSGITTTSMGTNGAAPTSFDTLVDAVGVLRDLNEYPTAVIYSTRTEREFGKLKDSTSQPMAAPSYLDNIGRFATNQIPNNLTQGSSNVASDIFAADWSQLLLGVRTELQISILHERYADTGQIGVLAWWRGDVQVARPAAFGVTIGVL